MTGEVANTDQQSYYYQDKVGNTYDNVKKHLTGEDIKQNILTLADGINAVVYDGKTDLSIFLARNTNKKYNEDQINSFIINADRQDDEIEFNATRDEKLTTDLQAGDVIILDNNNVKTVSKYKAELEEKDKKEDIDKQIKAQEQKIADRKKKTWGWGITVTGGVVAAGLGIAAICASGAVLTGLAIAAGAVVVVTGAALGIRALVNSFKKDNAQLNELKEQQAALEND